MKGKDPVRSWYTTPLVLLANAPKQKNIHNRFIAIIRDDVGARVYVLDQVKHKKRQDRWCFLQDGRRLHQVVLFLFWTGAVDTVPWAFHVAFCRGGAGIEIFEDQPL